MSKDDAIKRALAAFEDGKNPERKVLREDVESPAEWDFVWTFQKYCHYPVCPQYEVPTGGSVYRIDFVVDGGSWKLGIEIDGQEYHQDHRDYRRDQKILDHSGLRGIVRFSASDVWISPFLCFRILQEIFPATFYSNRRPDYQQLVYDQFKSRMSGQGISGFTKIETLEPGDYNVHKYSYQTENQKLRFTEVKTIGL